MNGRITRIRSLALHGGANSSARRGLWCRRTHAKDPVVVPRRAAASIAVARREVHDTVRCDQYVAQASVFSLKDRLPSRDALAVRRQREPVERCALERREQKA